jgi:spermidine synthase
MFNNEKILFETDTALEHYQVVDMTYEGRKARVLFTGRRSAAFSGMPLDDNSDLLFDYIQRFFELVASVRPKKLLMIGGGTFTLPTALLHALPDIKIDVVEIDPGLEEIAEGFFGFKHDPRLKLMYGDGKDYLKDSQAKYDMVIIDAFTHLKIPESLAAPNTPALIHRNLNKQGIVAINIISSYLGRNSAVIRDFYKMYQKVFDHTEIYPADTSTSLWMSQNFLLISKKSKQRPSYGLRYSALDPTH